MPDTPAPDTPPPSPLPAQDVEPLSASAPPLPPPGPSAWQRRKAKRRLLHRIVRGVVGVILVVAGAILGPVPGIPGIVLGLPGMILLASEFRFARKLKVYLERKTPALRRKLKAWGLR